MDSWSYYIVSNYRRISSAFIAVIFLFLGTEAAAGPILPPIVYSPCLPKIREARKPPIPLPLPGPQPFPIGCLIPGCDLAVTGPLELHVELSGDLKPSAQLELDGLSQDQIRMLQLSGEIRPAPDQQTTFEVKRGESRVSGLRVDLGTRMRTEELVTKLMERAAAPIIPTVQLRLSIDAEEAEKWVTKKGKEKAQKAGPKIAINLKVIQGKTTINESITDYEFIPCENLQVPPVVLPLDPLVLSDGFPPDDWIHVTKQVGGATVNLGQVAVALVNGLTQNGLSTLWVGPEAYKANTYFPMRDSSLAQPEDRIETNNQNNCDIDKNKCAEVSVFAEGLGMTLSTLPKENPPKDWKTGLGEIVEIPVTQNGPLPNGPLVVPVKFYILWEHPNDPQNPIDPAASCSAANSITDCLADWWLSEANTVWGNMWSGIQFEKLGMATVATSTGLEEASCDEITTVYNHFGLTFYSDPPLPSERPTAVRVFFVRESLNTSYQGNTIIESALGWTCTGTRGRNTLNNIFISTSSANRTTLAHEFGHALSLWHVNDPSTGDPLVYTKDVTGVYPYFDGHNLMWTNGTLDRTNVAKSQAFRGNVNSVSAVHRHEVQSGVPRECPDEITIDLVDVIGNTCPKIYVDK